MVVFLGRAFHVAGKRGFTLVEELMFSSDSEVGV